MNFNDNELTSLTWLHTINILPQQTNRGSGSDKKNLLSFPTPLKHSELKIINKEQTNPSISNESDKIKVNSNRSTWKRNRSLAEASRNESSYSTLPPKVETPECPVSKIRPNGNASSSEMFQTGKEILKHKCKSKKEKDRHSSPNNIVTSTPKPSNVST